MFAYRAPLTGSERLKRTVRATQNDNGLGLAAQLAYDFSLPLFPALLFLLALIGFLPVSGVADRLAASLAHIAPPDVATIVRDQLGQLWQSHQAAVTTFGFIAASWTTSAFRRRHLRLDTVRPAVALVTGRRLPRPGTVLARGGALRGAWFRRGPVAE